MAIATRQDHPLIQRPANFLEDSRTGKHGLAYVGLAVVMLHNQDALTARFHKTQPRNIMIGNGRNRLAESRFWYAQSCLVEDKFLDTSHGAVKTSAAYERRSY